LDELIDMIGDSVAGVGRERKKERFWEDEMNQHDDKNNFQVTFLSVGGEENEAERTQFMRQTERGNWKMIWGREGGTSLWMKGTSLWI
jgi:hypothetical protein